MRFPAWTQAPCATCGAAYQVTRSAPLELLDDAVPECPECAAYRRGAHEARNEGDLLRAALDKARSELDEVKASRDLVRALHADAIAIAEQKSEERDEARAALDEAERRHRRYADGIRAAIGDDHRAKRKTGEPAWSDATEIRALRSEAASYRRDLERELDGARELRERFGAREDESFAAFVARLHAERDAARDLAQREDALVALGRLVRAVDRAHVLDAGLFDAWQAARRAFRRLIGGES